MYYVYRCTADKLEHHLNRVTETGDEVVWPVFLGGRDWLLVCRKPRVVGGTVAAKLDSVLARVKAGDL